MSVDASAQSATAKALGGEWPPAPGAASASELVERADDGRTFAGRDYFPELDGLRFFAFLLVYLFHQGVPGPLLAACVGSDAARVLRQNGWVGVQSFFILSGFLITTLLLREESRHGAISLRAFWIRRAARIWPLYYLVVALGFFLIPAVEGTLSTPWGRAAAARHLPAFLAFGGNWSMFARGPVGSDVLSVLWSVCVEEQFYLVVPLLIALVGPRRRLTAVAILLIAAVAGRAVLVARGVTQLQLQYNSLAQFDTLLSGVWLAIVWHKHPPGSRAARLAKWGQVPLFAACLWLFSRRELAHGPDIRRVLDFVAIWLCGLGLVAVALAHDGVWRRVLAYRRFVWLGKISYGLYMYHEVAFWLRHRVDRGTGWFANKESLLAVGAFAGVVALAAVSYYAFERPFLKLKKRWSRVPSRPL